MPGFVIHLAIGKEYLKRNLETSESEFLKGTIFPDLTDNKSTTHYGKSPAYTNLKVFLLENEITESFNRGHFVHLIADYLFYNKYLDKIAKPEIYNDYDYTNKYLMDKYNVKLPDEIKDMVFFKEGKTSIFTVDMIDKLIYEIAHLNLDDVAKEILNADAKKWRSYKNLG